MDKRITLIAGLTALLAVGSVHAQATCPIALPVPVTAVNAETGHTYELYRVAGIDWEKADICARSRTEGAATGHLATITSSRENTWIVDTLLKNISPGDITISRQVWVGGLQASGSATPGDGWGWVNNEGPFAGVNGAGVYTNWSVDDPRTGTVNEAEPNDAPTIGENGQENHLTLGRFAANLGAWNDEGSNLTSIYGFIVEFDTPRLVTDCQEPGGCTTVEGQKIEFPATAQGNSFTFAAYEFLDPRWNPATQRCDRLGPQQQLEVFAEDDFRVKNSEGVFVSGKIVIPAFLCGSPKFLIVRAEDNGGISIPSGVVITTNNTKTNPDPDGDPILPGNFFECEGPSPQQKDVGVWQELNPANMREVFSVNPAYAGYFGSVAELTTACGSTVLKSYRKSNFLVGLHYDFGVPFNSAAEYQAMLDLTKKKVSLTLDSVNAAIADKRFIKNPDGSAMQSQLTAVLAALNKNDLINARKKTLDFINKVKSSGYKSGEGLFNYNGDHLSRGENILFMLNKNLIPFKNSPVIP